MLPLVMGSNSQNARAHNNKACTNSYQYSIHWHRHLSYSIFIQGNNSVVDPEGFHLLNSTETPFALPLQVETGSYSALTDLAQPAFPVGLPTQSTPPQPRSKVGSAPWNSRQINRRVGVVNLSRMCILLLKPHLLNLCNYNTVEPLNADPLRCGTLVYPATHLRS